MMPTSTAGTRLASVAEWREPHRRSELGPVEIAFLDESGRLQRETNEAAAQRAEELEGFVRELESSQRETERHRRAAETSRLGLQAASMVGTDHSLALLLAAEAHRRDPGPESWSALFRGLRGAGPILRLTTEVRGGLAVQRDGDTWLVVTPTEVVRLDDDLEVVDRRVLPAPSGTIRGIPRIRDGCVFWRDQSGRLWSASVNEPGDAELLADATTTFAVSASGRHLAIIGPDRVVRVTDREDQSSTWTIQPCGDATVSAMRSRLGLPSAIRAAGEPHEPFLSVGMLGDRYLVHARG